MMIGTFKRKGERIAHVGKDNELPKLTKTRIQKQIPRKVVTHRIKTCGKVKLPSQAPKIVAFGTVRHETKEMPTLSPAVPDNDVIFVDESSLKMKLKVGDSQLCKLRRMGKPDDFNEEMLFTRNLRRSVRFSDDFHRQYKRRIVSDMGSKNPCYGSILTCNPDGWSYDTPVPNELLDLHTKYFHLKEERYENQGPSHYRRHNGKIMDWDHFLTSEPRNVLAVPPVTNFKWVPLADIWGEVAIPGLSIELRNPFITSKKEIYWIGTIIHFAGYRSLVKFESFNDSSVPYIAWISFCSDIPKPLGWCKQNSKELKPGPIVKNISKQQLQKHLEEFSQRSTISSSHYQQFLNKIQEMQDHWNPAVPIEAMDVHSLHQNRLARVTAAVGDRVHLTFQTTEKDQDNYSDGYWCHYRSQNLHPLLWSQAVGIDVNGVNKSLKMLNYPVTGNLPSWPEDTLIIKKGMKLETLHPFMTYKVVGAVVVKVLKYGYFMVHTRESETFSRLHFVHHVTSPYVLPWGFGTKHGIEVDFGEDICDEDQPGEYFDDEEGPEPGDNLQLELLDPKPAHKFQVGDKIEAFELINTTFLGPATILKIAGHLLFLHFDGWLKSVERNYQWVDANSTEIYPLGYSELLGFQWQGGGGGGAYSSKELGHRENIDNNDPKNQHLCVSKSSPLIIDCV